MRNVACWLRLLPMVNILNISLVLSFETGLLINERWDRANSAREIECLRLPMFEVSARIQSSWTHGRIPTLCGGCRGIKKSYASP